VDALHHFGPRSAAFLPIACCPESSSANGQRRTRDGARAGLSEALSLILIDRRSGRGGIGLGPRPLRGIVALRHSRPESTPIVVA